MPPQSVPPQSADRPGWFVGIKRAQEKAPIGAGCLFAPDQIVTCAHVVDDAVPELPPTGRLWAMFAFCKAVSVEVEVIPGGWFPDDDIALLRLLGDAPDGAEPARLAVSRSMSGHACTAHGYPRGQEWEATPARVTVDGLTERDRILVSAGSVLGFSFEPGYSGSPLWDHALGAVIGMVAQRVRPRASAKGGEERDIRTAFAISLDRVGRRWQPLAERIEDLGPSAGDVEDTFEYLAELLDGTDRAPVVRQADIYDLGVSRSKYARADRTRGGAPPPPETDGEEASDGYIPRPAIDEALDQAFSEHDFVIAVGGSASGKSRSMVELLRRRVPQARVIVPIGEPTAPARLSRLDLGGEDGERILWLDDIHRYLGLNGIDLKTLDRFRRQSPPIKIVGTLTQNRLAEIQARRSEDNASRMPNLVLNRAKIVEVPSLSDSGELTVARERYPDEDFSERGIGETLVAARELEAMFLGGRVESPYGWAVLQAAVDWRRMGLDTPVSRSALRELTRIYLTDEQCAAFDEAAFSRGLAWATAVPAGSVIAPVQAERPPEASVAEDESEPVGYRAYDYMVELASGYREAVERRQVPRTAWDFVVARCDGAELLRVAFTVLLNGDQSYASSATIALAAGEKALETSQDPESQDPETAAYAQLLLGYLQGRAGNQERAIQLLEAAERSGIADVESAAHVELAGVLIFVGELDRAERLIETAMTSADPGTVVAAKTNLAAVLYQRGHVDRALTLLEDVLSADDEVSTAAAGTMLAEIVGGSARGGVGDEAKSLVSRQTSAGKPTAGTGVRQAVQPIAALPVAAVALSGILMEQGDLGRARSLLQRAYEARTFQSGPMIEAALGTLAIADGDLGAAEGFLQAAVDSGDYAASTMARMSLAQIAAGNDDRQAVRAMLSPVARGSHAYYAPMASVVLGEMYLEDGERDAALAMFNTAYQSGRSRWHYAAGNSLAVVYLIEDDGDEHGRALLTEAAASPFPDLSARASDLLGDLMSARNDFDGAKEHYWDAINSGDPFWAPTARTDLAILLADQYEDLDGAADLLPEATGARDSIVAGRAQLVYGLVDLGRGRVADGVAWLHLAADSEHPAVSEPAHVYLAVGVAIDSGELHEAVEILDRLWRRIDETEQQTTPALSAAAGPAADQNVDEAAVSHRPANQDPATIEQTYLAHCERFAELGEPGRAHAMALLNVVVNENIPDASAVLRGAAYTRLGLLAAQIDNLGEARRILQSAVDIADPASEPMARNALADVLLRLGELEAARRCAMPVVTGSFGVSGEAYRLDAFRILGRVAEAQQRPSEAVRWFGMAARSAEDDELREQIIAEIAAVRTDTGHGPGEPARSPSGSFEILEGQSFEIVGHRRVVPGPSLPAVVVYLLGRVAIGEGAEDEARRWLREAVATGDAGVAERAGIALEQLAADLAQD